MIFSFIFILDMMLKYIVFFIVIRLKNDFYTEKNKLIRLFIENIHYSEMVMVR